MRGLQQNSDRKKHAGGDFNATFSWQTLGISRSVYSSDAVVYELVLMFETVKFIDIFWIRRIGKQEGLMKIALNYYKKLKQTGQRDNEIPKQRLLCALGQVVAASHADLLVLSFK